MEKIICALWAGPGKRETFNTRLLAELPQALRQAGASGIRLNLRDAAVAEAEALIQRWQTPQQDAVVQFWLPSANALFRGAADTVLARHCDRFAAWLVAESTIIPNRAHPPAPGERCQGWSQASFITFRPDLPREEAMRFWHGHHTRIAIETQANFEYIQNAIVCPLTDGAPAYDAFVEECFPSEAMRDSSAFFDAVKAPERLAANMASMLDSCARFIDGSRIDIIPASQYNFGGPRG